MKIAYEIACLLLGEQYLRSEPDARRIRRYLHESTRNAAIEEELYIRVRLEDPPNSVGTLPPGMPPVSLFEDDMHYAIITGRPEGLFALVFICGHVACSVRLSKNVPAIGQGFVISNRHGEAAHVQTMEQYLSPIVQLITRFAARQ